MSLTNTVQPTWQCPELTVAEQVEHAGHITECLAEWKMVMVGLTNVGRIAAAYLYATSHTSPGDDTELVYMLLKYAEGYGGELYSTDPTKLGHRYTVAELEAEAYGDDE
jgi:hypothetical protein